MAKYRDKSVNYRTGPRGVTSPYLGIDLSRQDDIDLQVTDMQMQIQGTLSAAVLKKCRWALNDVGTAELDVSNLDPAVAKVLFGERELQVVFNDTPNLETWQGPFQDENDKPGLISYSCESLAAYLKERIVENASLLYTSVDQFDIGWGLVQTAQAGTNYDRNINASYAPSGVIRSQKYARDQHKVILDALKEFPVLTNGFDWDIVVSAGQRLWTPYYPQKGSFLPNIHLEWGRNIVKYQRRRSRSGGITKCYATGGTSSGVKFEQSYENVAASVRFGAMVGVVSDGTQKDLTWLAEKAELIVSRKSNLITTLTVTVVNQPVQIFGVVHTGDSLQVDIDDGSTQIHDVFRVKTLTWNQDESIDLEFVNPADLP